MSHALETETAPKLRPTRFDMVILTVIAVVIAAILLTIALGDRIGVTLGRVAPLGVAHSTSPIVIEFSEPMNRASAEARLRLEPAVTGQFVWSGRSLAFRPDDALTPGATYTVILESGAIGESGRQVLSEHRYSFSVRTPRIAYMYPADGYPQNVWIADPAEPGSAQQITESPTGIYDFAVSPDGTQLAFAEKNDITGTNDIKLLDLDSGALIQLTNCVDASCTTPVWRPDGEMIAYERVDYNTGLDVGSSPTRIWLLDLTTIPATTRPLFADTQLIGYNAQWSDDGARIALYDNTAGAILVYDFNDDSILAVSTYAGTSGSLSPDGTRLIYPDVTLIEGQGTRSYLLLAELDSGAQTNLSSPDDPIEDGRALWNPDGTQIALARRYQDERHTRGYQVYIMDPQTAEVDPVTDDPRYANQFFWWDPTGTQLVLQRFPELDENMQPNIMGRPEIWTADLVSGELTLIAENGFLPRWVP